MEPNRFAAANAVPNFACEGGSLKLTATEPAYVHPLGLYITQKCDACSKFLNQSVHYTIMGQPEVYCTAVCRDIALFGDLRQAKKQAIPGRCAYCGGRLKGKRRGALFCEEICKKRLARKSGQNSTVEVQSSGTPTPTQQQSEVRPGV